MTHNSCPTYTISSGVTLAARLYETHRDVDPSLALDRLPEELQDDTFASEVALDRFGDHVPADLPVKVMLGVLLVDGRRRFGSGRGFLTIREVNGDDPSALTSVFPMTSARVDKFFGAGPAEPPLVINLNHVVQPLEETLGSKQNEKV